MKHLPRCGPTGRWLVLTSLMAVAACSSDGRPTAPAYGPHFDISDAVHEGGTPGFFFLPPVVGLPATGGAFDADITTLNPQVAICDVSDGPDVDCGGSSAGATPAIIVYTTTSTPAITVVPTGARYQVNWDTKLDGFVAGNTYRVHVTAGARGTRRELGFADMLLTATPGQVKQLATGDLIVLNDGRTLPIRFRIESDISGRLVVSAATASITTEGTDLVTAKVQDLHGAVLVGATVAWSVTTTPDVGVADPIQPLDPTAGQTDAAGATVTMFRAGTVSGTATVAAATGGLSATASITVTARVVAKPLYVANSGQNSIVVFAPDAIDNATPIAVIGGSDTRLDVPVAVALDGEGNIYVANSGLDFPCAPRITVYHRGASGNAPPTAVIAGSHTGLCDPFALAVDAAGNLYVANHGANSITIYGPGADGDVAPAGTIFGDNTGLSSPSGLALDASGKIYVTNQGDFFGGNASVEVFASGARGNATPTRIAGGSTGLNAPAGIALDAAGNMYVTNANASPADITIYRAGDNGDVAPMRTIITNVVGGIPDLMFVFPFPIGIAVDASGNVHVASFGNNSVVVYAAGASGVSTPLTVIAGSNTGLSMLGGLAF